MTTVFRSLLLVATLTLAAVPGASAATPGTLEEKAAQLRAFDALAFAKVMVVGTFHFDEAVLAQEPQESIEQLVEQLARYAPTKIVIEWEPSRRQSTNERYQRFLNGAFDIADKPNEVYQVGFRLAQSLAHDQLYLFDDQTEFIGSLKDFSFDALTEYAKQHDAGFYDRHEQVLIDQFEHNQEVLSSGNVFDQIALRNSPQAQNFNARRMHLYENRIGVQGSWIGPDWLGRFYRRNVRMASNVLKFAEPGDRVLILVGDNHKWVLDYLFEQTPEFEVESSWLHLLAR